MPCSLLALNKLTWLFFARQLSGGSGSGGGGGGNGGGGSSSDISKDHCNKTVDIFEDISSPEVSNQNLGRPLTCWYRFRTLKGAPRDFVLRLRFKKFKVGQLLNATHCEGGYLQVSTRLSSPEATVGVSDLWRRGNQI